MTYEIALQRLTALCASAEHCEYEMTEKMRKWEVDESDRQRIVEYLRDAKFVDDAVSYTHLTLPTICSV